MIFLDLARSLKKWFIILCSLIGSVLLLLKRKITESLYSLVVTRQFVTVRVCVLHASKCSKVNTPSNRDVSAQMETVNSYESRQAEWEFSLSHSSPVPRFWGFIFFCPRCSLGLLLIMLRAISLSDSALPRRLSFAFFLLSEGVRMKVALWVRLLRKQQTKAWRIAADDIRVVHVCLSIKWLSKRGVGISLLSTERLASPLRTYQCPLIAVKPPVSHMNNTLTNHGEPAQ